jgi:phosphoribosylaminoimidazole-succinocarboxamide synthase
MAELLSTSIPELPSPRRGKVREVYDLGDQLLIVASDRISAFDVVMSNGVPDKGRVLTQLSNFWFDLLGDVCPNHIAATSDDEIAARVPGDHPELCGRSVLARKAKPLPIECIARGYISGSLFKEYKKLGGTVHELTLPAGLVESDKLPEPIFTPATKAQTGHDENISFRQAADIVGVETAEKVRDWTLAIFDRAMHHAASKGIILADTKFEFGETEDGLIWIDEALTPDSSRFWDAASYKPGGPQPSYDKQYLRDYLETLDWDKRPPGPVLPEEVVQKTRAKYLDAYRLLTGAELAVN